mgnify:CR=1 FL=1
MPDLDHVYHLYNHHALSKNVAFACMISCSRCEIWSISVQLAHGICHYIGMQLKRPILFLSCVPTMHKATRFIGWCHSIDSTYFLGAIECAFESFINANQAPNPSWTWLMPCYTLEETVLFFNLPYGFTTSYLKGWTRQESKVFCELSCANHIEQLEILPH